MSARELECHYCGRVTPVDVVCCEGDRADKESAEAFGRAMAVRPHPSP